MDQHLDLAFKRILKVIKQLLKDFKKQPSIEATKGDRSYSRTLRGFIQTNVSKKRSLSLSVAIDAQVDKN